MRSFIVAASLIAVATAQATTPVFPTGKGAAPQGNAIKTPGLDEQVPVGKVFKVTWTPDATVGGQPCDKVTVLQLRGPSTNVVPKAFIAQDIPNSGSCDWTPPATLENDKTGYGIQIICSGSGFYQYSNQFGVSNPNGPQPGTTGTATNTATETASATGTGTGTAAATETVSLVTGTQGSFGTYTPAPPLSTEEPVATTSCPPTLATSAAPSYTAPGNVTTPSAPAAPTQTGAASSLKACMGLLAGALAVAFAL
jgi:hypothetical protein